MTALNKFAAAGLFCLAAATAIAAAPPLLNDPVDVSGDFRALENSYYLANQLGDFDPATHAGKIVYQRAQYRVRHAFDNDLSLITAVEQNEFPAREYAANPALPFSVEFISPRALRIKMTSGPQVHPPQPELMLAGPVPQDDSWKYEKVSGGHRYTSTAGSVTILENPFHIELRDAGGKLLTATDHADDNKSSFSPVLPFSFVRRAADYSRSYNAAFTLSPGEKIFGCGESFTGLDKRGQKLVLWTDDANGIENQGEYKPVPFFMSSRGYGMFVHTTTPITLDFGHDFSGVNSMMIGDDELDLFIFLGTPKEILDEYTKLTGKSPLPPLWSFGLWMSRCTYNAEQQVRDIAGKLRENKIPCDVLHLDTGWFETDWQCDYEFSKTRFTDPKKMLADLKSDGFRVSCWQLPYFVPKNKLFPEIVAQNLVVRDAKGNLPYEDAVLDFSNPKAVEWYQGKLANLLNEGVSAIKVDFGEAAPSDGIYADGRTGFYEHNLYPLRYNKAVADITKQTTGDNLIWARSAWAGSQRYPIHWGGDAESTDDGMAAELRGGLSFGLSGFSFWSHDVGGFTASSVAAMDKDLFARWLAFGMLSSHSRCHGEAPKEPWNYGDDFMNEFRTIDELKYRLMPYVYAQAKDSSEHGLPMVRALFVEFPDDPGSWSVDDEYLYGSQILVAPLLHNGETSRQVYLPPGTWIDYQSGKACSGGWQTIEAGKIPAIILVRDGSVLPHIALAQSTAQMDWSKIELTVFAKDAMTAKGLIFLPGETEAHELTLTKSGDNFKLDRDPLAGKVKWEISLGRPLKMKFKSKCLLVATLLCTPLLGRAGNYTNFSVAVYVPINIVQSFDNPQKLQADWDCISRQLKVDKVYIEVQRDRNLITDEQAERAKKFFLDHGVQVAGGMALSDGSVGGQFQSFCYTAPNDRAFIKHAAEFAAKHFDEVIQDDFFFVTTKNDSDIAAKGDKSWTQFRLELLDDAAENLIVKPAKAVNPKVKMVIKFPNWYEHFQGSGFDLEREPKIFDGIHTGTETRDPVITDQHLQQYESYEIIRYFENLAPGRNGGGWVDTFSIRYLDRYAEQVWDTMFAKAREFTVFEWSAMTRPFEAGDRAAWANLPTSFNFSEMTNGVAAPTWARVAGYSLEQVDKIVGQLGNPIGIASYRPPSASGEDFLHNYFGNLGIPIDLRPEFPTNANLVLLTEAAKADPNIVAKIKGQLRAGKSVVITSGLLRALQGKGIEDIAEIRWTDRKFLAHQYAGGFGAGNFSTLDDKTNADVLFPEIDFLTNDSWSLVRAEANGNGFPLLLMNRYSKGTLYVWTMPDNFTDLYALPPEVVGAIKNYLTRGFPVRLDGPAQVALFAYDNGAFIVQNFSATAAEVKISTLGNSTKLKNLVTGETLEGQLPPARGSNWRNENTEERVSFKAQLPPHSYAVFTLAGNRENASASSK